MAELTLEIPDRQGWREWLEHNHESEDIVWLVILKQSAAQRWLTYPEALEEAICFGWIDSRLKRVDHRQHVIRFSKRKRSNAWSLKNLLTAKELISKGKMTAAGLAVLPKDLDAEIALVKQRTEDELKVPEDLASALKGAGLEELFASMSPSHRRAYFHWITQAKRPETRKKRVAEALGHIAKRELPMDMTKWKVEN
jgi:uncharacterized protein YdeI (YjbR/CyaY-like superfamily)